MCDKVADYYLPTFKVVSDWFAASRMIKTFDDTVFFNYDIFFLNEDSDNIIFSNNKVGILSVDLNNIKVYTKIDIYLDDATFDESDSETNIHLRLLAWCNRFKQQKTYKKHKQRINACSIASYERVELVHARRQKRKKEMEPFLISER